MCVCVCACLYVWCVFWKHSFIIRVSRPNISPFVSHRSHIFFVLSAFQSFANCNLELLSLTSITTLFSLIYHISYEKPGIVANIEGILAKVLFLYGVLQLFFAPSSLPLLFEIVLFIATTTVFIVTNIRKDFYDPWHCFMHIFPPIWIYLVASYHKPFFI